jgi:hypothetical protein
VPLKAERLPGPNQNEYKRETNFAGRMTHSDH